MLRDGPRIKLFLSDFGTEVEVDNRNIKKLENSEIQSERPFVECVSLTGIEAAGDGDKWTARSKERLQEIVHQEDLSMTRVNQNLVTLSFQSKIFDNPVGVEDVHSQSVAQVLLSEGLALPEGVKRPNRKVEVIIDAPKNEENKSRSYKLIY